jgi:hypothetical protein
MAEQDWVAMFPQADQTAWTGAGTALTAAATPTTISPMPTGATADYNKFVNGSDWTVGKLIEVTARGFITTTATGTTATWFLGTNLDNTGTTYVTLATTAAINTLASAVTGLQWELWATIRCLAVASSGNTLATQGTMKIATSLTPTMVTPSGLVVGMPNASGETNAAVNTLRTQGIALRATLAAANATIQCTQWMCKTLN